MKVLIVVGHPRNAERVYRITRLLLRSAHVRMVTLVQHFEEVELGIERYPDVIIADGTVLRARKKENTVERIKFPDARQFAKAKKIAFIGLSRLGARGPLFLARFIPLALRLRREKRLKPL